VTAPPSPWLAWARRVEAIAQNGLTYTEGPFDRQRYEELQEIAAGMLAALDGGAPPERVLELLRAQDGYQTPKVDVRGAVFQDGKILLVREREDGRWTLPGGWADVGESPAEAVVKEIREESGYETRAVKLLAVWDRDRHGHPPLAWYTYKLVIRCELTGGAPVHSIETEGAEFFAEDGIPPLSLTRVVPSQIARLFAHLRDPGLPTDFD
jgi:ADP-ribose pyrophosphatase YjhB (NUDIX family)